MKLVIIVPIILIVSMISPLVDGVLTNDQSIKYILDGAHVHPIENITRAAAFIAYHDYGYDAVIPDLDHMNDPVSVFSVVDLPKVYLKGLTPVVDHGKPAGFLPAPCFVPDGGIQRTLDKDGNVVSVHALTKLLGRIIVVNLDKDTGEIIS